MISELFVLLAHEGYKKGMMDILGEDLCIIWSRESLQSSTSKD
jgi:hypothetical protein